MSASPVLGAYCYENEYKALVARPPDEIQLSAWRNGVVLEDGYRTQSAKVRISGTYGKGAWLQVTLTEGKKRQIREMGRLTGLPAVQIIRVRIDFLTLGKLKPSQWRHLTPEEVAAMKGKKTRFLIGRGKRATESLKTNNPS